VSSCAYPEVVGKVLENVARQLDWCLVDELERWLTGEQQKQRWMEKMVFEIRCSRDWGARERWETCEGRDSNLFEEKGIQRELN
jgi:hypothetical protein